MIKVVVYFASCSAERLNATKILFVMIASFVASLHGTSPPPWFNITANHVIMNYYLQRYTSIPIILPTLPTIFAKLSGQELHHSKSEIQNSALACVSLESECNTKADHWVGTYKKKFDLCHQYPSEIVDDYLTLRICPCPM